MQSYRYKWQAVNPLQYNEKDWQNEFRKFSAYCFVP
ncbi:hypothetical protein [Desulfofarcimen acetoxidans]